MITFGTGVININIHVDEDVEGLAKDLVEKGYHLTHRDVGEGTTFCVEKEGVILEGINLTEIDIDEVERLICRCWEHSICSGL